jgi:plastocyanin
MPRNPTPTLRTAARLAGAAALLASGGIHLDLYITGYHALPTIGPLFLVQTVSALALGLVLTIRADEILPAGGALLAVGTLAGYVLSRAVGMFGFHEVASTAGLSAGLLDTLAFVALGYVATSWSPPAGVPLQEQAPTPTRRTRAETLMTTNAAHVLLAAVGLAALVLTLVDGISSGSSPSTSASASTSMASAMNGSKSVTITIDNFAFAPSHVTVTPGERIVVHNEDPVAHTLTAIPGSTPFGNFTTGNVASGQTKSVTAPGTAGTYQYYCAIHNFMTGSITVNN